MFQKGFDRQYAWDGGLCNINMTNESPFIL